MNTHSTSSGLIVGAAALARFIYSSDDEHFQCRVYNLTTAGCKCPLPHSHLGNWIAARRSTILARIEEQEGRP
ncbi:MAG: hypothetical protein HC855_16745 [Rhizobiales bacterium]|nr:hypothetical protein [Hyphomicrobiales bacterium]